MRRLLAVAAVSVLLAVGGLAAWEASLREEYEARLEALRAAGEPVLPEELALPPVPDDQNGAALLREAGRVRREVREPDFLWKDSSEWTPEEEREAREHLERLRPLGDLLDRALACPALHFDVEWEKGPNAVLETIPLAHDALRYLDLRAQLADDPEEALRSIAAMLDLSERLEVHTVVQLLMRRSMDQVAVRCLGDVAAKPGFDARSARERLEARFARREGHGMLLRALRGERTLGLWYVDRWQSGELPTESWARSAVFHGSGEWAGEAAGLVNLWPVRAYAYRDGQRFLDLMDGMIEAARLAAPEAAERGRALAARAASLGSLNLVTRSWAPLAPRVFEFHRVHQAHVRMARAGLALLERRQETGGWPDSIPPAEDVRFERTGAGIRLSVAAPGNHEIAWELPGGG